MRHKIITPIILFTLLLGVMIYAASGHTYRHDVDGGALFAPSQAKSGGDRRMVDMIADDSYLVDKGDSTIFILVGNFAAHHNGTVILADSAVRYSNQSFECFGNVLINQNDTYAYGDRAEYNRDNSTATLYSDLVKVVDGDAIMYSYNCTFNTADNIGYFHDGCYIEKGDNLLEAERGYYNTETHDLIAVDRVEMRDDTYLMTGDSVIFNTATENAQYFTNTNIWNDKDEYLFANEGLYDKSRDLHYLTRDAYILSPEREIWSDTIEYFRTDGHIIGRGNIQMDDTTQKILGFADYGEWWDEPGNAFFTRRPSMINYDPEQPDSLYLSADTLWMYTIAVAPPVEQRDSTIATDDEGVRGDVETTEHEGEGVLGDVETTEHEGNAAESVIEDSELEDDAEINDEAEESESVELAEDVDMRKVATDVSEERKQGKEQPKDGKPHSDGDMARDARKGGGDRGVDAPRRSTERDGAELHKRDSVAMSDTDTVSTEDVVYEGAVDGADSDVNSTRVELRDSVAVVDSLIDSLTDSTKVLTAKQLRYRAKLEKRRVRDSVRNIKRSIRDSINAIKQAEKDSIRHIRDSLLDIKLDTLIAQRRARSAQEADAEAARLARVKQKADERYHRKIDRAKARALKRGKEYMGPDYVMDSLETDTLGRETMSRNIADSMAVDSLGSDTTSLDSMMNDSLNEVPFPEDSVYKMIKAYRHVKMYRSDSQLVSDSLVLLNTDSIIRLYKDPVMWNEGNQISSDSMAIYTKNQLLSKAHFMGDPIMAMEIDTMYYNQVKGKDMTAYFADGAVYRNDVEGNAQTIYYMQNEDSPEVTGLMYIESSSITFYLVDKEIDKISYKQNPTYVIYPMGMIPETQDLRLKDFDWYYDKRPTRDSVFDRSMRDTRREDASVQQKPRFRITERINYDRRRLVENGEWEDRVDELTPEVVEWRNTRTSYKK